MLFEVQKRCSNSVQHPCLNEYKIQTGVCAEATKLREGSKMTCSSSSGIEEFFDTDGKAYIQIHYCPIKSKSHQRRRGSKAASPMYKTKGEQSPEQMPRELGVGL
jgi:hypothetical protein